MARILVVEDSELQAKVICAQLEAAGMQVLCVSDGIKALEAIDEDRFDAVVTDMIMPRVNGLQLVESLSQKRHSPPVILMTAFGNDEIAAKALAKGAASYVPKAQIEHDLVDTINNTVALQRAGDEQSRALERLIVEQALFVLENDPALIPPVISYIQSRLNERFGDADENLMVQTSIALQEALLNAIHHGNLEVSSELREQGSEIYHQQIEERREQSPYKDRRVTLKSEVSPEGYAFTITDEGPGFDPSSVPDPRDPANLERVSGRGLYLIFTFMDEVEHNDSGNEIRMIKKVAEPGDNEAEEE